MSKSALACPECGAALELMCVLKANESGTGKAEKLWLCNNCLSSWRTYEKMTIERLFFD